MLVFNLTNQPLVYRGRTLPPEGMFDFRDLTFIPARDRALEKAKILSFGVRPIGWKSSKPQPMTTAQVTAQSALPVLTEKTISLEPERVDVVKVEEKLDFGMKKKKY